jgi:hypothetical protein
MADVMYSDACCTRAGWVEYFATAGEVDLHVSVAPDSDLDALVTVFCHDEQEMLTVNGWQLDWEEVEV